MPTNMQRIVVICRLNAARSILVGAALKKFAQEFEIVTCGVDAITGTEIPQVTHEAAGDWGLRIEPTYSVNIKDVPGGIQFEDIILISDEYMKNSTYLEVANPTKVFLLADFALDSSQIPQDPVGMNLAEFKREIAKAIFCASRIIYSLIPIVETRRIFEIYSISANDKKSFESLIKYCQSKSYNILLANFEIPIEFISANSSTLFELLQFDDYGRFLSSSQEFGDKNLVSIFGAKHEMTFPNEDLFSLDFSTSALKLATKRPLVIVFDFTSLSPRITETQLLRASQFAAFPLASPPARFELNEKFPLSLDIFPVGVQ